MKQALKDGNPVIGTVYETGGHDTDYDHIVPFIGYSSNDESKFDENDIIYYNDLYYTYTRHEIMKNFVKTRKECSKERFLLPKEELKGFKWCIPKDICYGSKILGFKGMEETVRAKLDVGTNCEPDWSEEDK